MKKILSAFIAVLMISAVLASCAPASPSTSATSSSVTGSAWLSARLEKTDGAAERSITVTKDASAFGVDLSAFADDGFVIRASDKDAVILARTDAGIDRAVRFYANNCAKTPGDFYYTDGEGTRVGSIILSGADVSKYVLLLSAAETGDSTFGAAATENVEYAASVMEKYVREACGVSLRTEHVKGLNKMSDDEIRALYPHAIVLLSDPTASGDSPFDSGELGAEAYDISLSDGIMRIVGGNMRGCMYAVYDVLEKDLGWRFLTSDVTYVYPAEKIEIADFSRHFEPSFDYRYVTLPGKTVNCFDALRHNGHESFSAPKCAKYGWSLGTTWYHAHSFEYQVEGCGQWDQPCLSDPDVLDEVIESMTDLIEERMGYGQRIGYELTQISCSMNDSLNYCVCKDCKRAYNTIGFTELYMKFVNAAADAMAELFPGMMVYTIAYQWSRVPPTENVPRDNVIIHYCMQGCNNHRVGTDECAAHPVNSLGYKNDIEMKNIEGWAALTDHLYVWSYSATFFGTLFPSPNIYEIYDEMKYYASLGAEGMYAEGVGPYNFEELKSYLYYRMMWDASITREEFFALIDEYLTIVYGEDAAVYLKEYIDLYQTAGDKNECWSNNYHHPFDELNRDYFTQHYEYMRELMLKAAEAAPDTKTEQKIEKLSCHVEFLGLQATYNSHFVNGTDKEKEEYQSRYSALLATMRRYGMYLGISPDALSLPSSDKITDSPLMMLYGVELDAKETGR